MYKTFLSILGFVGEGSYGVCEQLCRCKSVTFNFSRKLDWEGVWLLSRVKKHMSVAVQDKKKRVKMMMNDDTHLNIGDITTHMPPPHHHHHHHHHHHQQQEDEDSSEQEDEPRGQMTKPSNSVNAVASSPILQFIAQETRLFNIHLRDACAMYEREKKLPSSLFGVKAIRAVQKASGKKATAGEKRKPTAFNIFIKKRIQEIKESEDCSDVKYTAIFKRVVEEWGELTDEQKKAFYQEHAHELQGDDDSNKKAKVRIYFIM